MKHNKKRNTAFLYESLVKELTKAVVRQQEAKKKTIITRNSNPMKYWTKTNYSFWHTASDYTVYEYTFKKSYNRLSGILKVKSHHLVTSQEEWYDYECSISQ